MSKRKRIDHNNHPSSAATYTGSLDEDDIDQDNEDDDHRFIASVTKLETSNKTDNDSDLESDDNNDDSDNDNDNDNDSQRKIYIAGKSKAKVTTNIYYNNASLICLS